MVDSFGKFNLTIDSKNGFKDAATNIQFTLTDTSGTWANAFAVLLPNSGGWQAASHIFVCQAGSCDPSLGALTSGFVVGVVAVPLPGALFLFGSGFIALTGHLWRWQRADHA